MTTNDYVTRGELARIVEQLDHNMNGLRTDMNAGFRAASASTDALRTDMNAGFAGANQRMDRFERKLSAATYIFGTLQVLTLALVALVAMRVGL